MVEPESNHMVNAGKMICVPCLLEGRGSRHKLISRIKLQYATVKITVEMVAAKQVAL
jgi:hypothetical protein